MIGDEQSEKLKRHIEENIALLSHHLQSKLDKLCTNGQHDVTEIFEKYQQQNQQFYEDKNKIIQLFIQHKQESLHVLQKEADGLKQQLEEVIEKQHAERKKMVTLYSNSQFEIIAYLRIIIIILILVFLLFIYILLNQARAGRRPARAWFLKITSVRMYVCVCVCVSVCVCVRPRGHE